MRADELEGLICLVRLIGHPAPQRWVEQWVSEPNPRLEGQRPSDVCIDRSTRLRVYSVAAFDAGQKSEEQ